MLEDVPYVIYCCWKRFMSITTLGGQWIGQWSFVAATAQSLRGRAYLYGAAHQQSKKTSCEMALNASGRHINKVKRPALQVILRRRTSVKWAQGTTKVIRSYVCLPPAFCNHYYYIYYYYSFATPRHYIDVGFTNLLELLPQNICIASIECLFSCDEQT